MVFQHENLQPNYLRLNRYDDVKHRKNSKSYIPPIDTGFLVGYEEKLLIPEISVYFVLILKCCKQ